MEGGRKHTYHIYVLFFVSGKILLSDLKKSKLTPLFFNTFVNIEKYLDNEQRELQPTKVREQNYMYMYYTQE